MFNKKSSIEKIGIAKTRLTIAEYRQFVDCVSGSVVFSNELHKENFESVFLMTCLDMFTSTPLIKKDETGKDGNQLIDFEASFEYCKKNKILEQIENKVGIDYLNKLYDDCLETIEFKKEQAIAMSSPLSALLTSIKTAVDNMDMSKAKDILEMASKMNNAGLNDSGKIIDAIVKNANDKKDVK